VSQLRHTAVAVIADHDAQPLGNWEYVVVDYFDELELGICLRINALSQKIGLRRLFAAVSRLGDWPAYAIVGVACAARLQEAGPAFILHALLTAGVGVVLYKALKHRLVRERPYITHNGIVAATAPLDRYSFPSGHTMHALSFAILFTAYVPVIIWIMAPFAVLVAASRVVLGLHYPSDVLVGAILGSLLAWTSLAVVA
jgi:undecaprenyl-diphosphatase